VYPFINHIGLQHPAKTKEFAELIPKKLEEIADCFFPLVNVN
jgi:hypothetical protein